MVKRDNITIHELFIKKSNKNKFIQGCPDSDIVFYVIFLSQFSKHQSVSMSLHVGFLPILKANINDYCDIIYFILKSLDAFD